MNPVRAGMVTGPRQYRWSSYRERMGLETKNRPDLDQIFLSLGENSEERRERYKEYVKHGTSDKELEMLRRSLQSNQLTGNDRFVEAIHKRLGVCIKNKGRGRPEKSKK
jgi:putative transposase